MQLLNNYITKFLIFGSIILSFGFLNISKVNAGFVDLSQPNRTCADTDTGSTTCGKADDSLFWDNHYFNNKGYIGNPGSTGNIYKSINFQWDDIDLCKGKTILISGTVAGLFDFFNNSYSVDVYNNGSRLSCNYSLENSSRLRYTCSGTGGGKFQINVNQHSFNSQKTYTIGVSKTVDITCDVGNSDIITNNNNNTQNIINNNNNNTQNIINNDKQNTQNIIDNDKQNTKDIIDNLNDNKIEDSEVSGFITDMENILQVDTNFITQLFVLPYNLLNALLQNKDSCVEYNLGKIFGYEIKLPCLNIESYIGSNLYTIIDMIFAGIISINFLYKLKDIIDNAMSLSSKFERKTQISVFR